MPDTDDEKKYVLTLWAKEVMTGSGITTYNGAQVNLPSNYTKISEARSNIIDGWQRIEIVFELNAETIAAPTVKSEIIELEAAGGNTVYFDDIRIQPFNSEMVSYVIDPVSLRLWATMDSRNFGTFYQYDEEGSLVRIIQETERGKVTVQENRGRYKIE